MIQKWNMKIHDTFAYCHDLLLMIRLILLEWYDLPTNIDRKVQSVNWAKQLTGPGETVRPRLGLCSTWLSVFRVLSGRFAIIPFDGYFNRKIYVHRNGIRVDKIWIVSNLARIYVFIQSVVYGVYNRQYSVYARNDAFRCGWKSISIYKLWSLQFWFLCLVFFSVRGVVVSQFSTRSSNDRLYFAVAIFISSDPQTRVVQVARTRRTRGIIGGRYWTPTFDERIGRGGPPIEDAVLCWKSTYLHATAQSVNKFDSVEM